MYIFFEISQIRKGSVENLRWTKESNSSSLAYGSLS